MTVTARLDRLLRLGGFDPCDHPDCGPHGHCATAIIHRKAKRLASAAFAAGKADAKKLKRKAQAKP